MVTRSRGRRTRLTSRVGTVKPAETETQEETPVSPETDAPAETLTDAQVEVVTATVVDEAEYALVVAEASTLSAPSYADITWGTPKAGKAWAAFGKDTKTSQRIKTYAPEGYGTRSLEQLESVVVEGLTKFIDAGNALLEIRMRKLWEGQGFSSFGTYAVARFNLSRSRLYQLIDISQVSAILIGSGVDVPRLSNRVSDLAVLKDNPEALAEVTQTLNEASPTGDLSDLPRNEVRDAVAEAANEAGKSLVADRSIVPANVPEDEEETDEDEEDSEDSEEEDEDEEDSEDDTDENGAGEEAAPARTPTARTTPRANVAQVRPNDRAVPASLVTVMAAFETGAYVDQAGETRSAVQRIAAMALSYMAGDFYGAPPKVSPQYTISPAMAKEIVKGLKRQAEKGKAKASLPAAQAAQVAANEAAVAAPVAAPAPAPAPAPAAAPAPAPVAAPPAEEVVAFSANPQTGEECYAILDAAKAWQERKAAGVKVGQSPVTRTQVNRANARLDVLTADVEEDAAREVAESAAEPVAEATVEMSDEDVEKLMSDLDEDLANGDTEDESVAAEADADELNVIA